MKPIKHFHLFLFACALATVLAWSAPAVANLDDAIKKLTEKIVKDAALKNKTVVVSANDMYDVNTGMNTPFSEILRAKVAAALEAESVASKRGATMDDRQWSIHLHWRIREDALHLTYTAKLQVRNGKGKTVSRSVTLPADSIDAKMMEPNVKSHSRTLVRNLAKNSPYKAYRTVNMRPVKTAYDDKERKVSKFFDNWLNTAINESVLFHPISQSKLYEVPVVALRTRGIRRVKKASAVSGGGGAMSLTSDLLNTESEIQSIVDFSKTEVKVSSLLNDRTGLKISTASINFPLELLPEDVLYEIVSGRKNAVVPQYSGYSKKDLEVELATTHGEISSVYQEGEIIRFLIRASKDAYVYLFDFDSEGTVTLIYPEKKDNQKKIMANTLTVLPDDGLDYELQVQLPFGKDTVFLAVSEEILDIPFKLPGEWAKTDSVRGLIRKLGDSSGSGYGEAQVSIETIKQ